MKTQLTHSEIERIINEQERELENTAHDNNINCASVIKSQNSHNPLYKTLYIIMGVLALAFVAVAFSSCSSAEEPFNPETDVTDATVTFTYTVPEEIFDYVMIDAVYNNNEHNDVICEPVLDKTFTITYRLQDFPITAPVVFQYYRTNRPMTNMPSLDNIQMETSVKMNLGGREIVLDNNSSITAPDITMMLSDTQTRTYAVKITRTGNVAYVNP